MYLSNTLPWLNDQWVWVLEVFIIVLVTLIIAFFVQRFLNKLAEKTLKTKNPWDHSLVESIKTPIKLFIWLVGLTFAADLVSIKIEQEFLFITNKIREIGIIVILTWFLLRLAKRIENSLMSVKTSKPLDETTARALGKLVRASIIITAILIIMQSMGYSISGILAFGGIGGIAVGFAAKDLLANFFGGLMIYLDRPFVVGDWIRSPDRDIEGTVEDIGWRLTRIRTFDKRPLYVPNAIFAQISLENPSRMLNRRIKETIGIRYDDANKMSIIVDEVKKMLSHHPDIDVSQTMIVNFNAFAPSSLDFFIYTFTKTTDWIEYHSIKQDVMLKVIDIIEGQGAECAFPTSTLHIADGMMLSREVKSASDS